MGIERRIREPGGSRRRGEDRRDPSSVVRFLFFLLASVLVVLILNHDTDRSMAGILGGAGPPAPMALSVTERTAAGFEGSNEGPRTAPSSASRLVQESCDDARVLVDRSHPLPPDYAPTDLVSLRSYGIPALGSGEMRLRREAAEHLQGLVSAAAADGEELIVASAHRSHEDQQALYDRLIGIYGSYADLTSARAGHSQHQLGTAVDFTNAAAGHGVWDRFGQTSAYHWLLNHAHEHGFVLAYPRGGEAETGYEWEPWHYRYVSAENARRLEATGLSPRAFLVLEGVVPRCDRQIGENASGTTER